MPMAMPMPMPMPISMPSPFGYSSISLSSSRPGVPVPAVRTPADMLKIGMEKLHARTGRDKDGWVEIARASGVTTHKALTEWLKATHGLNHNEAQWIAWEVLDPGRMEQYDRPADLVSELYSGKKAGLRPIHDALMAAGMALGPDVTSFTCKGYTSLSTGTQFAIVGARTNGAVDLELVLPDDWAGEPFKGSNPKFNRRFRLTDAGQVPDVLPALAAARVHVRGAP